MVWPGCSSLNVDNVDSRRGKVLRTLVEVPWEMPRAAACYWYHTMTFPGGETIKGSWSIPDVDGYLGNENFVGKSVLDIGTASGLLAFHVERSGGTVTGLDAASTREFRHLPFADSPSYSDRAASRRVWTEHNLDPIKRSWWYGWHRFRSNATCIYAPHEDLYDWNERYDIVIAGAIIEHLSDPVYAIGGWARVARETVIIAYVDVVNSEQILMTPMTDWRDHRMHHVWWQLSIGLYRQLFLNLGFDLDVRPCWAVHNDDPGGPQEVKRVTLVARRRNPLLK